MLLWHSTRSTAALTLLILVTTPCFLRPTTSFPTPDSVDSLLSRAKSFLDVEKDADAAFGVLAQIYQQDPAARGLNRLFERCFRLRVETTGNVMDRFGIASLLLDQERYEEASNELRLIVDTPDLDGALREKAYSMLFRANAACCRWQSSILDGQALIQSLKLDESSDDVPVLHPFEALKWPCVSLAQATRIAGLYARRTVLNQGHEWIAPPPKSNRVVQVGRTTPFPPRKLKLGYISPDFTSTHPLAFLMQDVFRHHNRDRFEVNLYSLSKPEDCHEVNAIRDGSDSYTTLSRRLSAQDLAEMIRNDDLDVLIDLCGYTGTTLVAEILTHRPSPIQISYMGFPGSNGAPYLDYIVCDPIVIPPDLGQHYTEHLIWMPQCYFVNSHKEVVPTMTRQDRVMQRERYGLSKDAFVFCCHSRPDKIDPAIFDVWMKALRALKDENVVLWLLQSGPEMERNLRDIAEQRYQIPPERLVFCDVAPRNEHLSRLGCSDVFLDTPSYNAHTLGCDALWAGLPMISLLRPLNAISSSDDLLFVPTDKLASRVGASLLTAAGLHEWIVPDLSSYQELMIQAVTDQVWFGNSVDHLIRTKSSCPLFDTKQWVENFELALQQIGDDASKKADILIQCEK